VLAALIIVVVIESLHLFLWRSVCAHGLCLLQGVASAPAFITSTCACACMEPAQIYTCMPLFQHATTAVVVL
jgi:hypothetical protein